MNTTYSSHPRFGQLIEIERQSLAKFRRALRLEDQQAFDELMEMAEAHSWAASMAGHREPMEVMLLAMLLELSKRIQRLEETLRLLRMSEPERVDWKEFDAGA